MALSLDSGTKPGGLSVKTNDTGSPEVVFLGEYQITMDDFLAAAMYVLTNTDLRPEDPRLNFIRDVKLLQKIEGFNSGNKRLGRPKKFKSGVR